MKHYNRRDFLKALGIGVTVAAGAAMIPAGSRIKVDFTATVPPARFPWEFWGETELTSAPGLAGIEHARLYAFQADAAPRGFQFFVHHLRLGIGEDVPLRDLRTFLETWKVSLHSGTRELMDAPAGLLFGGWGLAAATSGFPGYTAICPELDITNASLQVSAHGKPFPLTGPPLKIQCAVIGVGQTIPSENSTHGGRPDTGDQQNSPRVANTKENS